MSDSTTPWLTRRRRSVRRPREVVHDLVDVTVDGVVLPVYVIVWECAPGPVLYFTRLDGQRRVSDGQVAWQLCTLLLHRDRWADALLLDPDPVFLHMDDSSPQVSVHPVRFESGADGGLRLERGGRYPAGQIGRALGADLPIWVSGTETVATARAALAAPGHTASLPDESKWSSYETRLLLAVEAGLPEAYPLAWAALAADGARELSEILARHAGLPDRGRGWHLVARPRPPQPPQSLRRLLAGAAAPADRGEPAVREIIALRGAAGAMDRDDPRVDVYTEAAGRLDFLMFEDLTAQFAAQVPRSPHYDRVRAARLVPAVATWAGPVVRTWLRTLTPVPDLPAVLRQHRIALLLKHLRNGLGPARPGEVREAFLDRAGRYVLVLADPDGPDPTPWMCAEWPRDPGVAATWTDATVLAADRPVPGAPAGPLLALTPEGDGTVRADPLPAALVDGGKLAFEFGDHDDHRRGAVHVLRLLLPLVLEPEAATFATQPLVVDLLTGSPEMTLWPALAAPGDALRLRWDTIRAAAEADVAHARRLVAPDAPPRYQYFAIVRDSRSPVEELWQVVREFAGPHGYPLEERFTTEGTWTETHILDDIARFSTHAHAVQLRPEEVDRCLDILRARWAEH